MFVAMASVRQRMATAVKSGRGSQPARRSQSRRTSMGTIYASRETFNQWLPGSDRESRARFPSTRSAGMRHPFQLLALDAEQYSAPFRGLVNRDPATRSASTASATHSATPSELEPGAARMKAWVTPHVVRDADYSPTVRREGAATFYGVLDAIARG